MRNIPCLVAPPFFLLSEYVDSRVWLPGFLNGSKPRNMLENVTQKNLPGDNLERIVPTHLIHDFSTHQAIKYVRGTWLKWISPFFEWGRGQTKLGFLELRNFCNNSLKVLPKYLQPPMVDISVIYFTVYKFGKKISESTYLIK